MRTNVLLSCPKCEAEKSVHYVVDDLPTMIKEIVLPCRSCKALSGVSDIISFYKVKKYGEAKDKQITSEQLKLF